jgi:hypothetical protein
MGGKMAKQMDLSSRSAVSKKLAQNAMQERTGATSDIEGDLARIQETVDAEVRTYMGRGTPPPSYLPVDAAALWVELVDNAPEYHFKKTEAQSLAEFCWTSIALQRLMAMDPLYMEPEDMGKMTRFLTVSRALALRLRLGTEKNSLTAKQAIAEKLAKAEELTDLLKGSTNKNPRAGLMFGEGSNEIQ